MKNVSFTNTPKPYNDVAFCQGMWIREFDPQESSEDFVWHRDHQDRRIKVINGCGWLFQFDNDLPFFINKDDELFVPKMVYHRIIPGTTPLRIEIDEQVGQDT